MTSHRPPPPERESRWWWPIMCAAVAGVAVPPVVWSAQHFAPHPAAAQTFTIPPEQAAEPSAHGGLGGPLAIPSIGVVATGTTETANRPETPHTVLRPTLRVIATPETGSQALSGALVATAGPSTTTDPQLSATTTAPPVTTAPATTPAATTTPPVTSPSPSPTATATSTDVAATTTTASGSSDAD